MRSEVLHGDCMELLPTLDEASVDAIVTDPPYHLTSANSGGPTGRGLDTPQARACAGASTRGFMGKAWDGGDIAFRPETWAAALRVAKPGAYLVAFGGTRTFHRLMLAIEAGGWELRDTLMWVYGSGFPKSKNVGDGRGTALKPAWEPIVLARKPLAEANVADNIAAHGTGALNIDACRVLVEGEDRPTITGRGGIPARNREDVPRAAGAVSQPHELGRWPANVVHDGSDEVVAAFPEAIGQKEDALADSATRKTQNVYNAMRRGRGDEPSADSENEGAVGFRMKPGARRLDTGSAARFFYCAKASRSDRNDRCEDFEEKPLLWSSGDANPGSFQAESTKRAARNYHPTVKPTELMRWLVRLITPPGGLVLDPFTGSGSTGRAALMEGRGFLGFEREADYVAIANARLRVQQGLGFA
jgi:site-specific DNA-methyltransferase (adenine-specific)